jgi:hypothetical protein
VQYVAIADAANASVLRSTAIFQSYGYTCMYSCVKVLLHCRCQQLAGGKLRDGMGASTCSEATVQGPTWEMRLQMGALEKTRGREAATEGSYSSTLVKATSTRRPATQSATQPHLQSGMLPPAPIPSHNPVLRLSGCCEKFGGAISADQ